MYRYTVQPGDTLYSIAAQFNVPLNAILAANPGIYPYNLFVGQTVMIPTTVYNPYPRHPAAQIPFRRFPNPRMPGRPGMAPGACMPTIPGMPTTPGMPTSPGMPTTPGMSGAPVMPTAYEIPDDSGMDETFGMDDYRRQY